MVPAVHDVDEVEVVDLTGVSPDGVRNYLEAAAHANAPRATLRGRDAEQIAALWNNLPPGKQDRCHVPPFGLRFFNKRALLLEASLCWECNNCFGTSDSNAFSFEFDASAPPSVALLAHVREAVR